MRVLDVVHEKSFFIQYLEILECSNDKIYDAIVRSEFQFVD